MNDDLRLEMNCSPTEARRGKGQDIIVRIAIGLGDRIASSSATSSGSDFCLLLDVSESMSRLLDTNYVRTGRFGTGEDGRRVEYVEGGTNHLDACVSAAEPLIDQLDETDRISLVTFTDDAKALCRRLKRGDRTWSQKLKEARLGRLTNMHIGLQVAADALADVSQARPRRILLLTDGEATDGPAGLAAATNLAERGFVIDAMGFGTRFQRDYLQELVKPSRGRCINVEQAADVKRTFQQRLEETRATRATNVRLKLQLSDQFLAQDHYRGEPENAYLNVIEVDENRCCTLRVDDLDAHHYVEYYIKGLLEPQYGSASSIRIIKATASCTIAGEAVRELSAVRDCVVPFAAANAPISEDSQVRKGFLLAEVKRIETELTEAVAATLLFTEAPERERHKEETVRKFGAVVKRYQQLGDHNAERVWTAGLDEYIRENKISLETKNRLLASSSTTQGVNIIERSGRSPVGAA
jgi:hypothetical protein